jgi:hypothetical protein
MIADSIDSFMSIISSQVRRTSHDLVTVYRGHRDIVWRLVPTIARSSFSSDAFCRGPNDQSAESTPTEKIAPSKQNDHPESASPAAVELPVPLVLAEDDTSYSRCLPLLLLYLRRDEPGEKQLAEIAKRLDVILKQLRTWIECGIREGRVEKTRKKRKLVYVPIAPKQDLTLFDNGGETLHEIREAGKGTS